MTVHFSAKYFAMIETNEFAHNWCDDPCDDITEHLEGWVKRSQEPPSVSETTLK